MKAQGEIFLARAAPDTDLSPLRVLFPDLSVALWFHGSFERHEQLRSK